MSITEIKALLQNAGIVGAGGAGFPTYAKLSEQADLLCVNCSECEPLMYTDFILNREEMAKIVKGAELIMAATNIKHTYLAIKVHRAEALGYADGQVLGENVSIKYLPSVYPIGDEIGLIYETTGRLIKAGNLPITAGVIVMNAETVYNAHEAIVSGKPLVEKWLTIAGDIPEKFALKAPIGMRVSEIFKQLGIKVDSDHVIIEGGPSMGSISSPDRAVIKKTTKSILILPKTTRCVENKQSNIDDMLRRAASACCGCTRCTEMCPRYQLGYPLEPHKLIRAALNSAAEDYPELIATASLCCSCGVCAEVCCQDISPKDVILNLKKILAKNKIKFVADKDYPVNPDRPYRMIKSSKWKDMLGVLKFDAIPTYIPKRLTAQRVEIPTSQHIGAPSVPCVNVGDTVSEGDMIATAGQGLSVPQYASISGKVVSCDPTKIVIEA
ncbi:MAG: 4Fe-4S dicluster domain-containing protein [Eubacteriales bacterium]